MDYSMAPPMEDCRERHESSQQMPEYSMPAASTPFEVGLSAGVIAQEPYMDRALQIWEQMGLPS